MCYFGHVKKPKRQRPVLLWSGYNDRHRRASVVLLISNDNTYPFVWFESYAFEREIQISSHPMIQFWLEFLLDQFGKVIHVDVGFAMHLSHLAVTHSYPHNALLT